ncbi:MAG TPA: DUF3375 domain-containing protein [Planktothrix sp.]
MNFDFATLKLLKDNHPAWRLLCAEHAPLIASFLYRTFLKSNIRSISEPDLVERLEDELFEIRQALGAKSFPKNARFYLTEWTAADKRWLRKFYKSDSDDAFFDLTPHTEKAISWLQSLQERSFVGTESRLLTVFELLKQISQGSETDPTVRIVELQKRRDQIDTEIEQLKSGIVPLLEDSAVRDRFQQFVGVSRELLTDFREVEQNFRSLDRQTREKIALWDGSKGTLIDEIMGERDSIAGSDQGRSFHAFWDFLMSSSRQEEFAQLLERVLALPAVAQSNPDSRTRRIHHDWLEAGSDTQRTVAQLSSQLRRFLDDMTLLENRRISELLRSIEARAIKFRNNPPKGDIFKVRSDSANIELPMAKLLYKVKVKVKLKSALPKEEIVEVDPSALFSQVVIDKAVLKRNVRMALQERSTIPLSELVQLHPLEKGLAELIAYFQLATDSFKHIVDADCVDITRWCDEYGTEREASYTRIVFVR